MYPVTSFTERGNVISGGPLGASQDRMSLSLGARSDTWFILLLLLLLLLLVWVLVLFLRDPWPSGVGHYLDISLGPVFKYQKTSSMTV